MTHALSASAQWTTATAAASVSAATTATAAAAAAAPTTAAAASGLPGDDAALLQDTESREEVLSFWRTFGFIFQEMV